MLIAERLTEQVIGLAIKIHRTMGPGLLESAYEQCLCYELEKAGILFQRQVPVSVNYNGVDLGIGFKADVIVADTIICEIKSTAATAPVHEAQIRTYLRLTGLPSVERSSPASAAVPYFHRRPAPAFRHDPPRAVTISRGHCPPFPAADTLVV